MRYHIWLPRAIITTIIVTIIGALLLFPGDKLICQEIFDKSAAVIDAFALLPEDALTTPAQEQQVVDAMITLESTYSMVKKYGREQLTQILYTYLLSLGYEDADLQSL